MKFKSFFSILIGMSLIGISLGYVFGFYLHDIFHNHLWAYLGAITLGIGGGLVIYGTLYGRNTEDKF